MDRESSANQHENSQYSLEMDLQVISSVIDCLWRPSDDRTYGIAERTYCFAEKSFCYDHEVDRSLVKGFI